MSDRYSLFPHIRSVINDDGGVLLDLQCGRCLSLNPVGGQIWSVLQRHPNGITVPSVVDELLSVFVGINRAILESDINAFLPELVSKGLISDSNNSPSDLSFAHAPLPLFDQVMASPATQMNPPAHEPIQSQADSSASGKKASFLYSVLAMAALVGVDLTLKLAGFSRLYRIVKRWPTRRFIPRRSPSIPLIIASVDAACSFYLKRALCLQRSVVATCILRLVGVPAQLVLAARVMPFHGHAWVEADGIVVNDKQAVQTFYEVLDRC